MDNNELLDSMFKGVPKKVCDEVICIVDRSGSMDDIKSDAEGGLNAFLDEQKKIVDRGTRITIVEFDDTYNTVVNRVDITEVQKYVLQPRGRTALLDALGATINSIDTTTLDPSGKIIFVVVTDGAENASREFSREQIFKLITAKKEAGWEFVFLAANQDAISTGTSYGFDANTTVNFAATGDGVKYAYDTVSVYTTSLRTKSKIEAVSDLEAIIKSQGK